MATKHITDEQVVQAYDIAATKRKQFPVPVWPEEILCTWTSEPRKVCIRAMERSARRGLVEYGVSLRSGWLTREGLRLLEKVRGTEAKSND